MKEEVSDEDVFQQCLLDVCEDHCNNREDGSLGLDEGTNQSDAMDEETEDYLQPERE